MEDDRIRSFEEALWKGGEIYRRCVSNECLMVLPEPPHVLRGSDAIAAVDDTPRWDNVELGELTITRPQEGIIVIAYEAKASKGERSYRAYCTSTYRRRGHEDWEVIQHQQLPLSA